MEFKRVLLNKKIIIAFLLLIAVGTGFYLNTQYRTAKKAGASLSEANSYRNEILDDLRGKSVLQMQEDINSRLDYVSTVCALINYDVLKAEDYQFYADFWQGEETALRASHPQIAEEYDKNKNLCDAAEYTAKENVLTELSSQIEYISGYSDYLEDIDLKASQMNTISIFSQDNSLSKANISKTARDYAPLKAVTLSIGCDEPITTVMDFELIHYLIFAFGIFVVFGFVEERRRGLWNVVYSTPNGRFTLAMKRAGVLAVSVTFSTVIMYAVLFASSFMLYGGFQDIFRSIQSLEMFQNFIFPMSELQFIVLYVAINILTQLTLAFLIWFILSFIQNTGIALGAAGIIFAIEFALYAFLPIQSNIAVLKCLNVFYYINPTDAIIKYCNLNAFFFIINLFSLLIISAAVLIFVFAVLSILTAANKYPDKTPNRVEAFLLKLFGKITAVYWRAVEKLSVLGTELYKILIMQKGFVVLAVFVFVLISSINTSEVYYSGADSILNSFYEDYGGAVTQDAQRFVSDLEGEISAVDNELLQAYRDYTDGKITYDEYTVYTLKSDAYDSKREALEIIRERIDYIDKNKADGTDAWLVNPNGYNDLLSTEGYSRQQNFALLAVFCIIIIMSGVFSFEKRSLMQNSLTATYRGRQFLCRKKLISAAVLTIFIWLCTYGTEIIAVCVRCPLANLDAPLKSLEFLNGLPFNISIGAFLVILYASRLLLLLSVSYIVCLVSTHTRYEISIVVSLIVLIMPSLLYAVGIEAFAYISVTVPVCAIELIISSNGYTFIIPILLLTALGIISVVLTRRKWCNEGRCKK